MRESQKNSQRQQVKRPSSRSEEKEKARQARAKEQEEIIQGYEDEFSEFEDDDDELDREVKIKHNKSSHH